MCFVISTTMKLLVFALSLCVYEVVNGAEPTFGNDRLPAVPAGLIPVGVREAKVGRMRAKVFCDLMANTSSSTRAQATTTANECGKCFNATSDSSVVSSATNIPAYRRCVEKFLGDRYKPCTKFLELAAKESNNNAYKLRLDMTFRCIGYQFRQDVQEECLSRIRGLPDNGQTMRKAMNCDRELIGYGHLPEVSQEFGGGVGFSS